MSILHYLKPVTGNTFQLLTKQDCRPASPWRWTSPWREIAGNRHAPDNGAKRKYDRQIYSWEWQRCSFNRFKVSHDIRESAVRLFNKRYRLHTRITQWVWSNVACTNAIIKFAIDLKTRKHNHFTTHLKPGLRYYTISVIVACSSLSWKLMHLYYSRSHKMKGTPHALFGVATRNRLVTRRDTRNRGVMLITGVWCLKQGRSCS